MIEVIHRGQKFKETMEAFQQKRADFVVQKIRSFDAETLYVFLEWIRSSGHKLDRITAVSYTHLDVYKRQGLLVLGGFYITFF